MPKAINHLEITPADRELFILLIGQGFADSMDAIRGGSKDHQPKMQAIAAHRINGGKTSAKLQRFTAQFYHAPGDEGSANNRLIFYAVSNDNAIEHACDHACHTGFPRVRIKGPEEAQIYDGPAAP